MKALFLEKVKNLPVLVRFYIFLRGSLINPIIMIDDRERINDILMATKNGGTKILSSVELAVIKDIEHQIVHGKSTS